jgi:hemoglobin
VDFAMTRSRIALTALATIALCGIAVNAVALPAVAPPGSLYARLGGTEKVTAVVNETIDTVAADKRTNQSFDKVDLKRVKELLAQQICSLTGGGCAYSGDTMKDVHAGHHISNAEFYQLVEVLREAMRNQNVPLSARNELLEILAPMKRDVVER